MIPDCDGRTDRQTDGIKAIYIASYADALYYLHRAVMSRLLL